MLEKIKIVTSNIWTFVLPFLRLLMTNVGPILTKAAISAVAVAAASNGASNSEKRDIAYKQIVDELKASGIKVGIQVGEAMINAAIELAVVRAKSL